VTVSVGDADVEVGGCVCGEVEVSLEETDEEEKIDDKEKDTKKKQKIEDKEKDKKKYKSENTYSENTADIIKAEKKKKKVPKKREKDGDNQKSPEKMPKEKEMTYESDFTEASIKTWNDVIREMIEHVFSIIQQPDRPEDRSGFYTAYPILEDLAFLLEDKNVMEKWKYAIFVHSFIQNIFRPLKMKTKAPIFQELVQLCDPTKNSLSNVFVGLLEISYKILSSSSSGHKKGKVRQHVHQFMEEMIEFMLEEFYEIEEEEMEKAKSVDNDLKKLATTILSIITDTHPLFDPSEQAHALYSSPSLKALLLQLLMDGLNAQDIVAEELENIKGKGKHKSKQKGKEKTTNEKNLSETVGVLYVQYIEDNMLYELNSRESYAQEDTIAHFLDIANQLWCDLESKTKTTYEQYLKTIGTARYYLNAIADSFVRNTDDKNAATFYSIKKVKKTKKEKKELKRVQKELELSHIPIYTKELEEITEQILQHSASNHYRMFFLKKILKKKGKNFLWLLTEKKIFKWFSYFSKADFQDTQDPYLVFGDDYKAVKYVAEFLVCCENDNNEADEKLKKLEEIAQQDTDIFCVYILFAIYNQCYLQKNNLQEASCAMLANWIEKSEILQSVSSQMKCFITSLLLREFSKKNSKKKRIIDKDWEFLDLRSINGTDNAFLLSTLVHSLALSVLLSHIPNFPLVSLFLHPGGWNTYLPAAQENIEAIVIQAVQDRTQTYECPNGHKYVIGECGRAWGKGTCFCGAAIGGASHVLEAGNKQAKQLEVASVGYAVEKPDQTEIKQAWRNLDPTSLRILRILIHSSLLSCILTHSSKGVLDFLNSGEHGISTEDAAIGLLVEHITQDWGMISDLNGSLSSDEMFIMMLLVFLNIVQVVPGHKLKEKPKLGRHLEGPIISTQDRKMWEDAFKQRCLTPLFGYDLGTVIKKFSKKYTNASSRLIMKLTESLPLDAFSAQEYKEDLPVLMRYRAIISWQDFTHGFYCNPENKTQFPILHHFLEYRDILGILKLLPAFNNWQKLVFKAFNKRIKRNDLSNIGKIIAKLPKREKPLWRKRFSELKEAWNTFYVNYNKYTTRPLQVEDVCKTVTLTKITRKTPLIMTVVFDSKENTALAIMQFLIRTQNNFLEMCHATRPTTPLNIPAYNMVCDDPCNPVNALRRVPFHLIRAEHLIHYDHNDYLFQSRNLVVDQSLNYGEGGKYTFKFLNMERNIINNFVDGKPLIDVIIPLFEFREDDIGDVRAKLNAKITQRELPTAIKKKIISELGTLDRMARVSELVWLCISFLQKTGATGSTYLPHYVKETLRISDKEVVSAAGEIFSGTIAKSVKLMHIYSLYSCLQEEMMQDVFDNVPKWCTKKLPASLKEQIVKSVPSLVLDVLLPGLKAFMTDQLPSFTECDDSLVEWLEMWMGDEAVVCGIDSLPEDILLPHSLATYNLLKSYL